MSNYGLACKHGILAWCSQCASVNSVQFVSGDAVLSACRGCDSLAARVEESIEAEASTFAKLCKMTARVKELEHHLHIEDLGVKETTRRYLECQAQLAAAERVVEAVRVFGMIAPQVVDHQEILTGPGSVRRIQDALAAYDGQNKD